MNIRFRHILLFAAVLLSCSVLHAKDVVDYVNPYMGNISHMLKPTYPTVHLPNGMLRVYPQRDSYVDTEIHGLPIFLVNHREVFSFNLSVTQRGNGKLEKVITTDYDNELITPYYYKSDVENQNVSVEFAPSRHSAIYHITFNRGNEGFVILNASNGEISVTDSEIKGFQYTWGGVKVYVYATYSQKAESNGILNGKALDTQVKLATGDKACAVLKFRGKSSVMLKYGISFISIEQAKENLSKEISGFDFEGVKQAGRKVWNNALGKILVEGGSENDKAVFYTSLYRVYERPVCISEYGRHFNPANHQIENDSHDYYTDDWYWDTYRAAHPLRLLIDAKLEQDMLNSCLDYAATSGKDWLPTFPAVTGDSHRMNCNHGIAVFADAWAKGLRGFDLSMAFKFGKNAIEKKTLAPWRDDKAGELNAFYGTHGYIPALKPEERETFHGIDGWEKRQAVAVTLGTSYDQWCLSRMASFLDKKEESKQLLDASYNYRHLFNPATSFFHPKDSTGSFIEPFDYKFAGGIGARDYYDENNGWTYRWDVQHNVADLVSLMGGPEKFSKNLDQTFKEWLGKNRYEFYAQLPDQTGNVGQFTMGNEPSLHIPYLYNYMGQPWKTQKTIRHLIHEWFRNDLMGVPGDEDGGGLSAFVVFSMMGFYPVTPGSPTYNIGSPFFERIIVTLSNGKKLTIQANGCSENNKYISSATINGNFLNKPWFSHDDIVNGGSISYNMSSRHDANWATDYQLAPPSALPKP